MVSRGREEHPTFSSRLDARMKEKGLTQEGLAELVGTTQSSVQRGLAG